MTASLPAPIAGMLGELDRGSLAELERALTLRLHPAPTPAERRVAELGLLAELLAERASASAPSVPRIERQTYERHRLARGANAPAADTLATRYGGWRGACRAAHGLLPDGRHRGRGKPWHSSARGRRKVAPYSRMEIRAALRRCAFELGRIPSSADYHWWSREKRRVLRARGVRLEISSLPEHRIPGIEALYRHYPSGPGRFRQALRECPLDEVKIAVARARRLQPALEIGELAGGPRGALRAIASGSQAATSPPGRSALAACSLDPDTVERIEEHGFGWLGLREAIAIARLLGGSLEWLAGRSASRGSAPKGECFDTDRFRLRARERGLGDKEIRERLALPVGPYRRLMRGTDQPLLAELVILSSLAGTETDALVRPRA